MPFFETFLLVVGCLLFVSYGVLELTEQHERNIANAKANGYYGK